PASPDDSQARRHRWRRGRADDLEDLSSGVADDEQVAVGADAERADDPQPGGAAEFLRVLDDVDLARFAGPGVDAQAERPDAPEEIGEEVAAAGRRPQRRGAGQHAR